MTELNLSIDENDVVVTAAVAAHNVNAEVARTKGATPSEAPHWHDLPDDDKPLKIEAVKHILGLPNNLTDQDNVEVGNVPLFISVVRDVVQAFGYGVLVKFPEPIFVQAPQPAPNDAPDDAPVDPAGVVLTAETGVIKDTANASEQPAGADQL